MQPCEKCGQDPCVCPVAPVAPEAPQAPAAPMAPEAPAGEGSAPTMSPDGNNPPATPVA